MEQWQLDFEWLRIRNRLKDQFEYEKLPDLNAILLLIGVQELGDLKETYTKEEKQDLMHMATCRVLSEEGYYQFQALDADGWSHWQLVKPIETPSLKDQEELLKRCIVQYFASIWKD